MLRTYISHYADRLKISWEQLLGLGKINVADPNEKFSMSFLAANLAQEVNGVSWLHGEVSKEIFKGMWPGYMAEELHISYVTNEMCIRDRMWSLCTNTMMWRNIGKISILWR